MQIRSKYDNAFQQGYYDYKNGHDVCPFEDFTVDAQEWEVGWMQSRREGTRGEMKIGGELVTHN